MTSSASDRATPPTSELTRRALAAFDILVGEDAEGHGGVGIAVSGGSDSTALLVLAADWAAARGRHVAAATVDHRLRPEAREEAARVAHLCAGLGVTHSTLVWKRPFRLGPTGQAEARIARHGLLADWAHKSDIRVLALGHTRDDRIETFLMRARQGSGWHGLAGPLPSGASPAWPEGRALRLIRPLLAFGREALRAELVRRETDWVEDPSNAAERFERVRVRQLARRMDEAASAQALRVMDGLAQMRAAVVAEARLALGLAETDSDDARVSREVLRRIGSEARLRLLEALVMAAGGSPTPPRREPLERVAQKLAEGTGLAAGVTLAGAWIRPSEDGGLTVSQAPPRKGAAHPPGPAWDRARALLGDPRLAALGV
ncbi:MAG TPA: tRNA lysidine(34) synthetase TilS [Hyphomonadaceae bacterium]|nr:tRNA lysidine(34) synthetase TilS [Hyphomonadaceae bacterium]